MALFLVLAIVCAVTADEKICFRVDNHTFSRFALSCILKLKFKFNKRRNAVARIN